MPVTSMIWPNVRSSALGSGSAALNAARSDSAISIVNGRPKTSASVYPKVATALRFQNVMLPCASVEMIASRADCVTVENRRYDALRRRLVAKAARHVVEGVGHRRGFGAPTGGTFGSSRRRDVASCRRHVHEGLTGAAAEK